MSTYAIGDVQGCFLALQQLLQKIDFQPTSDILWFTGDLVNRGPQSLEVLRFVRSLGSRQVSVLGNHDIHLLAVSYKVRALYPDDTLAPILAAPDCAELIDWLRHRPLLHYENIAHTPYVITHAGLAPSWSLSQAIALAKELESALQSDTPAYFLTSLYQDQPDDWDNQLNHTQRLGCIHNYLTRMRYCHLNGRLALNYNGYEATEQPTQPLIPWFEVQPRANTNVNIIFGHWSALNGQVSVPNIDALDTGCVWGKCLTAMRLEDKQKISVPCNEQRKSP